jgi:hypothetical protein
MGENIAQVSCGFRGYVWAVGESGKVYRLNGVTADTPQGATWEYMNRAGIAHISIGDKADIWANDFNGDVIHVGNQDTQSWTTVDGSLVQLDVGNDRVVGVNNWGEIFFRETVAAYGQQSFSDNWLQINGHLKQVTTSQIHVTWGVDTNNNLWFYQDHPTDGDAPIAPPAGHDLWLPVFYANEKMTDLDVGRDGMVWGCTASNKIVYRSGIDADTLSGTEWITEDVQAACANIAVCTSGHVWAVTPQNAVIFRTGIIASTYDQDLVGTGW